MGDVTFTLLDGTTCPLETIPGADYALAPFPCCDEHEDGRPYPKTRIRAVPTSHDFDTHHCNAVALCCGKTWGRITVKVDTMFGIDEDRAVCARARVYT